MLSIGFVPLLRTTFDVPYAESVIESAYRVMMNADFTLVGDKTPVTDADEAALRSADFSASASIDVLVVLQATFADSTLIDALISPLHVVDVPILLWAVPEPHTGGRLRLNSLCGVNLGAHHLRRIGRPYHTIYANADDPSVIQQITALGQARRAKQALKSARIGIIGEHPAGFDTCDYDAGALRKLFGVEIVPVALREKVFADARRVESGTVDTLFADLSHRVSGLAGDAPTRGTLSTYVTLQQISADERLAGCAVRCWPEFFTELGCAACGALSLLTDAGTPSSCEADVNGTITQFILAQLSGSAAFGSDIVSVDDTSDALVLWHCGLAPLSMADTESTPTATLHSNRRLPLLMDFMLKPGAVTVARLSEATGQYRLVIGRADIVRGEKPFSGTTGLIRFARSARQVIDTILGEGLEHHIALTYGDQLPALRALAQMLELPILEL